MGYFVFSWLVIVLLVVCCFGEIWFAGLLVCLVVVDLLMLRGFRVWVV